MRTAHGYENMATSVRSVRFGNNSIDKVNLPIPGAAGPETYDNGVVHFERTGPKAFSIRLRSRKFS